MVFEASSVSLLLCCFLRIDYFAPNGLSLPRGLSDILAMD